MTLAVLPSSLAETSAKAMLRISPTAARSLLLAAVIMAGIAGFLATDPAAAARAGVHAGADLTRLLRAMAAIKAAMAIAVATAVVWRLGSPIVWPWLAAYVTAGVAMAAGPGLIWDMVHLQSGAVLLHAGLIATLVMLWRDPAVGRRLSALIAARRAARGA